MKLDIDNGSKVTEPDFAEKIPIRQKSRKCGQNGVFGPAIALGGSYVTSSVRQSVSLSQKFSYFPPLDFLDFLHQVSLL
jgi:hypothetical protein